MRLFVLVRHAQSLLNVEGIVNGDPLLDPGLSPEGIVQARQLGRQLSAVAVEAAVVSPFPRALATVEIALEGREIAPTVDDDLGDVRLGELEGATLAEYRAAIAHGDRGVRFPGGESLNETAMRNVRAFRRLLERRESVTLVVCHETAVRYAVNAAGDSDALDAPLHAVANATPYVFDEAGLGRAVMRVVKLAG